MEKNSEEENVEIIDFTDLDLDDAEQELDTAGDVNYAIVNTGTMTIGNTTFTRGDGGWGVENWGTLIVDGLLQGNGSNGVLMAGIIYNHAGGRVIVNTGGHVRNLGNGSFENPGAFIGIYNEHGGYVTYNGDGSSFSGMKWSFEGCGDGVIINNANMSGVWGCAHVTCGTLTMKNCSVGLGASGLTGCVLEGGNVILNSCEIDSKCAGVLVKSGTVTVNNTDFTGCGNDGDFTGNFHNYYPAAVQSANIVLAGGSAIVNSGNIYGSTYGVKIESGTLTQSGGSIYSNTGYDVWQNGTYNLYSDGRSDKIYLTPNHVVNVPSLLFTGGHVLYMDDKTDKRITRPLVTVNGGLVASFFSKDFSLGSTYLSHNANGTDFNGNQWSGYIESGANYHDKTGINTNYLYLNGTYNYTYHWLKLPTGENTKVVPYKYNILYTIPNTIDVVDTNIHPNLKYVGWTYDGSWLNERWSDAISGILPEQYEHALLSNENVYCVYDLQNVDLTYFGNGATESDETAYLPDDSKLPVTQKADGEYIFQDKDISNDTFSGVAGNPFYRIEEYTADDEYYFDVNIDGGEGAYVDYTQYYTYEGWSSYRDNLKTYNGDGTYHTTEAGADFPMEEPNLTKYFLDVLIEFLDDANTEAVTFTDDGRASLNLYATWDKAPIITAVDRYYNFDQLREIMENGTLNDDLLQDIFVKATDEEDGKGADKLLKLGTEVTVDNLDKLIEEIEKVLSDESSADHFGTTIRFKAEDKAGNITYYNVDLYMVNNEIHSLEPEPEPGEDPDHPEDNFQDEDGNWYHYVRDENGNYVYQNSACYVRRINMKNYLKHWKPGYTVSADGLITGEVNPGGNVSGALETYSKWYLDEDLQKEMYNALYNMEADTGKYMYSQTFDRDTIKQIQDEIFADPSKMQMDYIKSTWMKQYCNFN